MKKILFITILSTIIFSKTTIANHDVDRCQSVIDIIKTKYFTDLVKNPNITYTEMGFELLDLVRHPGPAENNFEYIKPKLDNALSCGADINQQDPSGNTALHYAADNGYMKLVGYFIKMGADTSITNNENHTAYERAKIKFHKYYTEIIPDIEEHIDLNSLFMINIRQLITLKPLRTELDKQRSIADKYYQITMILN